MEFRCPQCGKVVEAKEYSLPKWATSARSKFGSSVVISYCPHCESQGYRKVRSYYEEFIAGRVDVHGQVRPAVHPLPPKIQTMTFASFRPVPSLRKAYRVALRYAKEFPASAADGKGLLFYGPVGTGKTHLAGAICNMLFERGFDVVWANTPQFISKLKRSFDTGISEASVMENHIRAGLLVLDDIGSERPTEWVESRLYEVINARLERKAPIIFTSNCSSQELLERLGERIVSRIREMTVAVQFEAPDFRVLLQRYGPAVDSY